MISYRFHILAIYKLQVVNLQQVFFWKLGFKSLFRLFLRHTDTRRHSTFGRSQLLCPTWCFPWCPLVSPSGSFSFFFHKDFIFSFISVISLKSFIPSGSFVFPLSAPIHSFTAKLPLFLPAASIRCYPSLPICIVEGTIFIAHTRTSDCHIGRAQYSFWKHLQCFNQNSPTHTSKQITSPFQLVNENSKGEAKVTLDTNPLLPSSKIAFLSSKNFTALSRMVVWFIIDETLTLADLNRKTWKTWVFSVWADSNQLFESASLERSIVAKWFARI